MWAWRQSQLPTNRVTAVCCKKLRYAFHSHIPLAVDKVAVPARVNTCHFDQVLHVSGPDQCRQERIGLCRCQL